jgi:hypothetical protein
MTMIEGKFHTIDTSGIKWWVANAQSADATPYCIEHHLPLRRPPWDSDKFCMCDDCGVKTLPRSWSIQSHYVVNKIRARDIAKIDVINYNGELIPVSKVKSKDENYWVTAQIMDSKHGKQLVIYAGKKGLEGKMQAFVDTENHKLAFDHKDVKPTDVFAKIEATFKDGSKMAIEGED